MTELGIAIIKNVRSLLVLLFRHIFKINRGGVSEEK